MHAPLLAAQANYYNARARNPNLGRSGGGSSGLLQPGRINATERLKIEEKFTPANFLADKSFVSRLDPTIQAQLNTKPGSPSYNAGMDNVGKIVAAEKKQFMDEIVRSNATYKIPQTNFFSSED